MRHPVASGIVAGLAHPGGNVTGIYSLAADYATRPGTGCPPSTTRPSRSSPAANAGAISRAHSQAVAVLPTRRSSTTILKTFSLDALKVKVRAVLQSSTHSA